MTGTRTRSNRTMWVVGSMVVAAVVAAGLLFLGSGDGDPSTAARIRAGLDEIVAAADLDLADPNDLRRLDRCPIGDVDDVIAEIDRTVPVGDDLPRGVDDTYVFGGTDAFGSGFTCTRNAPDRGAVDPDEVTFLLVTVVQAPGPDDYLETVERYATGRELTGPASYRDGDRYTYCTDAREPRFDACYVDWYDVDARVAVLFGLGGRLIGSDEALAAFALVLDRVTASLAGPGS